MWFFCLAVHVKVQSVFEWMNEWLSFKVNRFLIICAWQFIQTCMRMRKPLFPGTVNYHYTSRNKLLIAHIFRGRTRKHILKESATLAKKQIRRNNKYHDWCNTHTNTRLVDFVFFLWRLRSFKVQPTEVLLPCQVTTKGCGWWNHMSGD